MKMLMYDYYCYKCDKNFEALRKLEDRDLASCPTCHDTCRKIPSATRSKLDPISGDFPGATAKWEKNHIEKLAQERKSGNHEE
jgi:putative FmdB family regulatory protein